MYPFSLSLNLEIVPSEKVYSQLLAQFERIQKADASYTWDRFVLSLADRLCFDTQLTEAAEAVAEDYTTGNSD